MKNLQGINKTYCLLTVLCIIASYIMMPRLAYAAGRFANSPNFMELAIDGVRIPSVVYSQDTIFPDSGPLEYKEYWPFYTVVVGEKFDSGIVFVPLRLVSEMLGAEVTFQSPNIVVTYDETTVKLAINSKEAYINQSAVTLDAETYTRRYDTVMVPVSFIAEIFNCQVDYTEDSVNIQTAPLTIDGEQAAYMIRSIWSSEHYGFYSHKLEGNLFIKRIYQTAFDLRGEEVAEPGLFSHRYDKDIPFYYWEHGYSMDVMGTSGEIIAGFKIFMAVANGVPAPGVTQKYLLFDGSNRKWYHLPETAYDLLRKWNWTVSPGADSTP